MTPFTVRHEQQGNIPVPCGKCPNCLARRASSWSFRLMKEGERSLSSLFVTLTYSPANIRRTRNNFPTLEKRDVQLFFKRLRKQKNELQPIKYYACGEYGGKTKRPHYHIILFNSDHNSVMQAWHLGAAHFGTVTGASIGYTLKYMSKPKKIPLHANDDRVREFSLMSKKLGDNYIDEDMVNWHLQDLENRMYINLPGNEKIAMPRYYKDKIYTESERKIIAHFQKQSIEEKLIKYETDMYNRFGENWTCEKAASDLYAFKLHAENAELNRNKI